ncbi:hypothetical protein [Rhodoferax sp.]|uniref:hypothetical protein n=1 Tax=Rhodoferax sp. TaxID=50421 RepID=UPI002761EAB4|nr:hypothetical protein [Rhodoferax sp.]
MNLPTLSALALALGALSSTVLAQAAVTGAPELAQPAKAVPTQTPHKKMDRLVIQGLASKLPSGWTPTAPSNSMRVAQFEVSAGAGAQSGELVAYFFAPRQGGGHEANIGRWASQFTGAQGKPVTPKVSTSKHGSTEVTLVELQGNYARGVGMGPAGDAKPDQALLTAMIETPVGRITLQMHGSVKTVAAHRARFLNFAKGFRPA